MELLQALHHGTQLVRPSGSLDAPLAHHLHQPSLATATPPSEITADVSNESIAMVMHNACRNDTLIYDHIHRRKRTSDGIRTYPEEVLKVVGSLLLERS